MPTERVLADFEGTWTIDRGIRHRDGIQGTFRGEAVWTPDDDGLAYLERGTLCLPHSPPMQAERRYRWGTDLQVWFEDGRFFHQVPPAGGHTMHVCDPDTYSVDYDFSDWPLFRTRWSVQGPRKDYVMVSTFTRRPVP